MGVSLWKFKTQRMKYRLNYSRKAREVSREHLIPYCDKKFSNGSIESTNHSNKAPRTLFKESNFNQTTQQK